MFFKTKISTFESKTSTDLDIKHMRGDHCQNAVLSSVLVNLILLFKTITTEFEAAQHNLRQHNRIWSSTTEFGAKEQNLRQQQNLGQHNGI